MSSINTLPCILGVISSIVAAVLLYRPFFGDEKDFWECVGYWLKPDFLSWADGSLHKDYGKTMKLGFFMLLVIGCGFMVAAIVDDISK